MNALNVRRLVRIRINARKNTLNVGRHVKAARDRHIVRSKKVFQMDGRVTLQVDVTLHSQRPAFAIRGTSDDAVISRQRYQQGSELRAFTGIIAGPAPSLPIIAVVRS